MTLGTKAPVHMGDAKIDTVFQFLASVSSYLLEKTNSRSLATASPFLTSNKYRVCTLYYV